MKLHQGKTYIFGQIFRVVTSGDSTTGKPFAQYSQYANNNKGKTTTTQGYHRIYLLRDLKTDDLSFYMIEDRAQNKQLWKKDTTLRDNVYLIKKAVHPTYEYYNNKSI